VLELPEVEVLRRDLEKEVVGKRVKSVEVSSTTLVKAFHRTRPDFQKALEDHKIEGIRRRGAVIFLDLDDDLTWVLDAGATGSLHRQTATEEMGEDTHLVVTFTTGGALHLSDVAREPTGSTGVVPTEESLKAGGIAPEAIDPLDDNPTVNDFTRFLYGADDALRTILTDPARISGIGDVYADEILWDAGLRHDRPSSSLSTQEVRRFYRSMQEVIQTAMKQRGSSLDESDAEVAVDDEGEVAEHLQVYGREGEPCYRCRRPILKTKIKRGSYTYNCEQCQV
jgi:formamidopyrimidine-DNA glycosylase